MSDIFDHTYTAWAKYSKYEYREDGNGTLFIVPSPTAKLEPYYPMKQKEEMVIDAINTGLSTYGNPPEEDVEKSILSFIEKYGFLGLITALPTTAEFIDYEKVYFTNNPCIKEESLSTFEYLAYFFPFDRIDFYKKGKESFWTINDREAGILSLVLGDVPHAYLMGFQREYAERYEWVYDTFRSLAYVYLSKYFFYHDNLDNDQRNFMLKSLRAYNTVSPTYKITFTKEKPLIIWDYYSLLVMVQMSLAVYLMEEDGALIACKNCGRNFYSPDKETEFCSAVCEKRYNKGNKHN